MYFSSETGDRVECWGAVRERPIRSDPVLYLLKFKVYIKNIQKSISFNQRRNFRIPVKGAPLEKCVLFEAHLIWYCGEAVPGEFPEEGAGSSARLMGASGWAG